MTSATVLLPLLALLSAAACCSYYDAYLGSKVSDKQFAKYEATADTAFYCVNKVRACDESEGRRIDGSCNNLQQPAAGAGHGRFSRVAQPRFSQTSSGGFAVRNAADGSALPGPRQLRTRLLAEGRVSSDVFTQLMMLYFVFSATDIAAMSIHDTLNYVQNHTTCCSPAGAADPMCAPIEVPADDPVHRFSGIRCFNMTWPISFQNTGCLTNNTAPERINYGTPFFDLSVMYGNDESTAQRQRNGTGGLLNYKLTDSGRHWPYVNTSIASNATLDGITGLTGVNFIFGLFFWREHNRLAAELAELNPCWTDDQLFDTAREINIGTYAQILYYELLSSVMGETNLQSLNVTSPDAGFRDMYDASVTPEMSLEALTAMRWVHTMQDGTLDLYVANGTKIGEYLEANLTLYTEALQTSQANIKYFAQGTFRQATGNIDNIVDPMMAEWVLGPKQVSTDVTSSDVAKSRLLGLAPYVDYLAYCNNVNVTSFEDLEDYMHLTKIEVLRDIYASVEDVDLTTGLWSEALVTGGYVPLTFYCLVSEQLVRSVVSDRHWFERDTRPNAFTAAQLAEIRKASVSRLMCDNADTVVEIQPSAFLVISEKNPLTDCKSIPSLDLSAWTDSTCSSS